MNAWVEEHQMLSRHLKEIDERIENYKLNTFLICRCVVDLRHLRMRQKAEMEALHDKWEKEGR